MKTYDYIIKKYNINVGRQHLVDVEGMVGSVALSKLFAELNFNKGVEVGVDRGLFSEILCKDNPKLELYGVDPWISGAFPKGNPYRLEQRYFDGCYEESVKRLEPYNATIIKKTSMDALEDFEDDSLDFVYIDANHDFVNFTLDLHHWIKKVRMGGIVSGHDYAYYSYSKFNHVKRALIAYARCYRMIPVFAVMHTSTGLKRDKYRSWFWVKDRDCP
jgi:hypothetical protein